MKRIAPIDAAFLDMERPSTPSVIAGFFVLDPATAPSGFVRHRDILRYVEERIHFSPSLRQRLVFNPLGLDEPRLVEDENFDLEFHVRHLALPQPRDRRQLSILTARLFSRPMDLERPLWEMYIVEGLENIPEYPADAFAIIFKLHHTAFDGVSANATIFSMLQRHPAEVAAAPARRWTPERKPNYLEWATSTMGGMAGRARVGIEALPRVGRGALQLWRGTNPEPQKKLIVPKTRLQQCVSSHRVFDWISLPMATIQQLRRHPAKPKVNDLALCIVAGALRRYLLEKEELPEQSLVAACPINTRGPGNPMDGGNHVSMMRLALATDIADPLERLQAIVTGTTQAKQAAEAVGHSFVADAMTLLPHLARSALLKSMSRLVSSGAMQPLVNTVVTNVPNPRGDYYFAGSKLLSYAGLGPVYDGYGLFHTVTSTEWELSISATSCREIMPDISAYMQCLRASFDELVEQVGKAAEAA